MNKLTPLTSVSPIDGRYHNKTQELSEFFSEFALIKYRVYVEVKYLIELNNAINLNIPNANDLMSIYYDFSEADAHEIKEIEKKTNHDVKAVEYFIKTKLEKLNLSEFKEFVHFGLTSQDINNTAIPLQLLNWLNTYIKDITELNNKIKSLSNNCKDTPMLAHTHGQPASPTKMDKELMVFVERLDNQILSLHKIELSCKFGGATGNFNAHHVAYPQIDWKEFANIFTQKMGLKRSQYTTQIDHYDSLAVLFDNLRRINVILIDFCRDIWQYISMNYFNQKTNPNETGSSAMPHKVNPIDFENAEGNLGMANAILTHLSEKLPISRLQRDLTDSTVLRNIGVPIAHITISIDSIKKGIDKLVLNEEVITEDLENNWSVVTEGIQTVLRREKVQEPYEKLKELSRGKEIDQEVINQFIDQLEIPELIKKELKSMSPTNYTGI
jgi:adenylosuccinate lyase